MSISLKSVIFNFMPGQTCENSPDTFAAVANFWCPESKLDLEKPAQKTPNTTSQQKSLRRAY